MRINKYIAHAGVASRRKAEELIKQGLVTVNGQVVRELATIIKTGDQVEVEGTPIYNEEKVYYLLNKPRKCWAILVWAFFMTWASSRIKYSY